MERYLITQSLLSSWAYIFNCWEGSEEEAVADFIRTLNREESEPTEAMLDGIAFENLVYSLASGNFTPVWKPQQGVNSVSGEVFERYEYPKNYNGAKKVSELVTGAQFQVRVSRELTTDGMTFVCYGVLDCLQAGVISDVKYKVKSFGSLDLAGSYFDSAQHPMYFYLVPEAYEFRYLVSDGQDLYIESYHPDECRNIRDIISEFIRSITEMGLLQLYKEKWLAK